MLIIDGVKYFDQSDDEFFFRRVLNSMAFFFFFLLLVKYNCAYGEGDTWSVTHCKVYYLYCYTLVTYPFFSVFRDDDNCTHLFSSKSLCVEQRYVDVGGGYEALFAVAADPPYPRPAVTLV